MTAAESSQSQPASTTLQPLAQRVEPLRWPVTLTRIACCYYALSALTMPFINKLWVGEVPLLAIIQLPKAVLKSGIQTVLMSALSALGLSRGSFSPDYLATHMWALGLAMLIPTLLVIGAISLPRNLPNKRRLILTVIAFALVDVVVTLVADSLSHLKTFNASFF